MYVSIPVRVLALHGTFALRDDVPCMDYTWDPSQYTEANVYPEVCSTTAFEEYRQERYKDCKEIKAYIASR